MAQYHHHQGMLYRCDLIQSAHFDPAYRVLADYALHIALQGPEGIPVAVHGETWAHAASGGLSRAFRPSLYREEWRLLNGWVKWIQPPG